LTDRKTLNLRPASADAPPPAIKKRGRGWEISSKRLDALHEQAREMKRFPSEAHKVLAERFSKADLGRYNFTRHAVVGSAIVDFNCHNLGMAIMIDEAAIDEAGANATLARRSDRALEAVGIKVMRLKATDILENIDDVLARITAGMRQRIADKSAARRQHHASHPRQTAPRYNRDGNGPPRNTTRKPRKD
jgi:very-short-patch-repair endonuclease